MANALSQNQYAKHRGCSRRAVQKAIESGRISTLPDGRIDPDAADAMWSANTDEGRRRGGSAPPTDGEPQKRKALAPGSNEFATARAIREGYQARLARLEYEQRAGLLISAVEVEQTWTGILSAARNRFMGIPSKLRVAAPHFTAEDLEIIEALIVEVLNDLADGADESGFDEEED